MTTIRVLGGNAVAVDRSATCKDDADDGDAVAHNGDEEQVVS